MKYLLTTISLLYAFTLLGQGGNLDPSFGNGGILVLPYFDGNAEIHSMVRDGGFIYAAGFTKEDKEDLSIVKIDLDGTLEDSFGAGGLLKFELGSGFGRASKILKHPDGGFVCIGWDRNGNKDQYVILKIESHGELDMSFGTDGVATGVWSNSSFAEEEMVDGLFLSDGRLIVAGSSYNGQNRDFLVACFNADGSACTDFGTDGYFLQMIPESSSSQYAYAIAADQNDNIYVGGSFSISGEPNPFLIFKYNSNGNADSSFGIGGQVEFGTADSETKGLNSMTLDQQGRILVAGSTETNNTYFFIQRFDQSGNLDTSFGDSGSVIMTSVNDALINDVKVLSNDQIVAGGRTFGFATKLVTSRYNDDGSLDPTFGNNGTITTLVESTFNGINALITDDESSIYAGGYGYDGDVYKMVIAKYTNLDVSISDLPLSDIGFEVAPNPANQAINIELSTQASRIHLLNMMGQMIHTVDIGQDNYRLDISHLESGQYILLAETEDGLMKQTFVKQ